MGMKKPSSVEQMSLSVILETKDRLIPANIKNPKQLSMRSATIGPTMVAMLMPAFSDEAFLAATTLVELSVVMVIMFVEGGEVGLEVGVPPDPETVFVDTVVIWDRELSI